MNKLIEAWRSKQYICVYYLMYKLDILDWCWQKTEGDKVSKTIMIHPLWTINIESSLNENLDNNFTNIICETKEILTWSLHQRKGHGVTEIIKKNNLRGQCISVPIFMEIWLADFELCFC